MKRTSSKKRTTLWRIVLLVSMAVILIGGVLLKITVHHQGTYSDSSLDGSEIAEEQETTIPSDVLASIKTQKKVLGVSTDSTILMHTQIHVPILMYHYVEYVQDPKDTMRIKLNTTPYTLEQEIKTLTDAGYTFMTMAEVMDVMDRKTSLPSKPIVLTFDDGYRDFYTDAYPILKKHHIKATQYVISGFLDKPNHLLTSQLIEIANDGLIEIGAHTVHHVSLKGKSSATVTYEVDQSKKMLENIIHKPVISFAYPYGAFDLQAVNTVQTAGFNSATSTMPGINQPQENRYFLYRLRPGGRTGQYLLSWLDSVQNNH